MTETQQDALLREKMLYRYTSAVERGDFETAAALLAQAESDPELERMIVEINAALAAELPPAPRLGALRPLTRWQKVRAGLLRLAPGVGVSVVVLLLAFTVMALIGPAIGNVFSNVSLNLPADRTMAERKAPYPFRTATPYINRYPQAPAPTTAPALESSAGHAGGYGYPGPYQAAAAQPTATTAAASAGRIPGYPPPQQPAGPAPTATPFASGQTGGQSAGSAAVPTNQPRLVVRTGYLSLTVADTRKTRDTVNEIINGYAGEGAYVVNSSERVIPGPDGLPVDQPAISMQIRVPVARYDAVMSRLVGLALKVESRQEQASDVTADYVDTQARIKELQVAINRLLEIAGSAKTTQDLLTVERELASRRAELEAMEGRAQYLSQTAALSLIQLDLMPKIVYPTPTPTPLPTPEAWRPGVTAHSSYLVLLNDLRRFGDWLIVFGITTLPWMAVLGLVVYGGYRVVRRKK